MELITVDDITKALITIVRLGVIARFIFCMIKISGADDEMTRYIKRGKNAVVFWVIAESVWILKDIVFFYYK